MFTKYLADMLVMKKHFLSCQLISTYQSQKQVKAVFVTVFYLSVLGNHCFRYGQLEMDKANVTGNSIEHSKCYFL